MSSSSHSGCLFLGFAAHCFPSNPDTPALPQDSSLRGPIHKHTIPKDGSDLEANQSKLLLR